MNNVFTYSYNRIFKYYKKYFPCSPCMLSFLEIKNGIIKLKPIFFVLNDKYYFFRKYIFYGNLLNTFIIYQIY